MPQTGVTLTHSPSFLRIMRRIKGLMTLEWLVTASAKRRLGPFLEVDIWKMKCFYLAILIPKLIYFAPDISINQEKTQGSPALSTMSFCIANIVQRL